MRAIPEKAVAFVSRWEGCKLTGYADSIGVATVGWGHTGPEVAIGKAVTLAQAKDFLRLDLQSAAKRIYGKCDADAIDALSESQWAALLSFVFNLGAGNWSIWKLINARRFDEVPPQMMRFVNAGGAVIKGLVNRRAAEVELWHEADTPQPAPSSSVTRSSPTPPTPADTKPLAQSKSFMTTGAAVITSATVAVGEVTKAVSPFAAQSEFVAHAVSTLAIIAAALAAAALLFVYLKKRSAA